MRWALGFVAAACLVAGVLVLAAGGGEPPPPKSHPRATDTDSSRRVRARPGGTGASRRPVPAAVARAVERMPVEDRVAQVLLVGFEGTDVSAPVFQELATRPWGAVLLGPDNALGDVTALAGEFAVVAANAGKVAPLVVAPADATPLPGIGLVLGPSVDLRLGEEDDPRRIIRRARAAIAQLRGLGVAAAPRTFPGQGAATQDPLEGPSVVGLPVEVLRDRDLVPFRALLRRAPAVVVSNSAFTAYDAVTPATQNPAIVGGLLRGQLGFAGAAISDDLAGAAVVGAQPIGEAAVAALQAGIDLLQIPDPAERELVYRAVLAAVRSGDVPRARLREAVTRVLMLKRAA